jgi:NAD(P)-dependent dehydrogenase (short-subunit alcohol dehydrogenase family)
MSKIAVVTGAGRGLGRLIAERLAATGRGVVCTDVDEAGAAETARRIGEAGGCAWGRRHDVRDPDAHAEVAAEAQRHGALDAWINNAGVLSVGPAWEQPAADARRLVEVNVLGVIYGARAAVPAMPGGGVIVNVASISSLVPAPGLAVYGATKHAVLGFSTSLQGDLDRAGLPIKVAAVCPDAMETDMVKAVAHARESDLLFSAGARMLRAEDVADEVARLVARPRLVTVLPRARAALVHAFRPFPALELKVLGAFDALGRRAKQRRGL